MPALKNPKHELYAQLFFAGMSEGMTQAEAYKAAGYLPTTKRAAEVNASRLMLRIAERVRELQTEHHQQLQPQLDISRERVARDLDEASRMAKQARDARGVVSAAMGMAKVFNLDNEQSTDVPNWSKTQSMQSIGRQLLQGMGFSDPDNDSIRSAIEANDRFIGELEQIVERARSTLQQ